MKHLKSYNEVLNESIDRYQNVIDDVRDILSDISDEGYNVEVGIVNEYTNDPYSDKLLSVEIFSNGYDYIDLPAISDTIVRLYDYMKGHQDAYNRNPSTSMISVPATEKYYRHVGWAQFDKRTEDAYKNLLNMTERGFRRMLLQWKPKKK